MVIFGQKFAEIPNQVITHLKSGADKHDVFKQIIIRQEFEKGDSLVILNISVALVIRPHFINLDKTIIELKYDVKHSSFVNNFIKTHYLSNRNQKFSKYVNSFIEINENGYI